MKINILYILIVSIFTACSPIVDKYHITIDATKAPNLIITPTTYTIKALGKDTDENSLKFQYHADILNSILEKKGYKQVDSINKAKEIIYFDYGIDKEFERVESYSEPNIGFGISIGNAYHHRYNNPFWSEVGYRHYTTYTNKKIYYNRYITILAKDITTKKELWRVDVSTIGESKNLKKIIPILLKSTIPYIGIDIKEPIKIIIKDKKVKEE